MRTVVWLRVTNVGLVFGKGEAAKAAAALKVAGRGQRRLGGPLGQVRLVKRHALHAGLGVVAGLVVLELGGGGCVEWKLLRRVLLRARSRGHGAGGKSKTHLGFARKGCGNGRRGARIIIRVVVIVVVV